MCPVNLDQLREPASLFARAAKMPRPRRIYAGGVGGSPGGPGATDLILRQRATTARMHPQLPPTPAWGYEGSVPGPVVQVRSGSTVRVEHRNEISGTLPYRHVVVDDGAGGSLNDAGSDAASTVAEDVDEAARVAGLHAHTVVHIHGAPTGPDSDGMAENVVGRGESQEYEYGFAREHWPMHGEASSTMFRGGVAPAFWYHDHAMGATRLNVYAGLAGMWLVRHPRERALGLPTGRDLEIPLVIADRNLDSVDGTAGGALDGRVLHKVAAGVREHFGPVNVVNGLAWPRCEVPRRVVRLRVLNGANARTYRLHLMGLTNGDESTRRPLPTGAVQQIGTDGGLLGQAVDLPAVSAPGHPGETGLTLAPGERADLLVDFGLIATAGLSHVVVYNSAPAPFGGEPLGSAAEIHTPDAAGFRATPQVMRFDLTPGPAVTGLKGRPIRHMALDTDMRRVPSDHDALPHRHGHTIVALREEDEIVRDATGAPVMDGGKPRTRLMLFVHEMLPQSRAAAEGCDMHAQMVEGVDAAGNLASVPAGIRLTGVPGTSEPLVSVGKRFHDTSMAMIEQGAWHLWKVINLSPDTHPFHIHLTQFQATRRQRLPVTPGPSAPAAGHEFAFGAPQDATLDANETGWKDTLRVNPGERDDAGDVKTAEMVTLVGCFSQHAGQYVYHCHILEHEDVEMMRPFTVMPAELMAGHGH